MKIVVVPVPQAKLVSQITVMQPIKLSDDELLVLYPDHIPTTISEVESLQDKMGDTLHTYFDALTVEEIEAYEDPIIIDWLTRAKDNTPK